MIEALVASIFVTGILVEVIYRAIRNPKPKLALASIQNGLLQFRKATTDEERQPLLIALGGKTLLLSTAFLGACVLIGIIAFAPLWFFAWDDSTQIIYFSSLTVLSILWFFGRVKVSGRPRASTGG